MRYCIAVKTALSPYISTNLHTPLSGSIVLYGVHIRSCISLYNLAVDTIVALHSATMKYLLDTWYSYSTVILTSCNETYRVYVHTVVNIFVKYHELNISVSHIEHQTLFLIHVFPFASLMKFDDITKHDQPSIYDWHLLSFFLFAVWHLSARP